MAKIIDWFPKIIFCAIPEIIMKKKRKERRERKKDEREKPLL